jgi:hypothetical protein
MDGARKQKLGQKHTCYACGAKFYDMARAEPICPKCQVDQRTAPVVAPPRRASRAAAKPARKAAEVAPPAPPRPRPRAVVEEDDEETEIAPAEDGDDIVEEEIGDLDLEDMGLDEGAIGKVAPAEDDDEEEEAEED